MGFTLRARYRMGRIIGSLAADDLMARIPDPKHPVVVLATERIEELSARKSGVSIAIEALKVTRPAGHHPDEIAAMLDAVPDLRKALKTASGEQLADIFSAVETVSYDKASQQLAPGSGRGYSK